MPKIEHQITYFRPIRSPTGPPMKVPAATALRNTNRWICADRTARGTGSSGRKCSSWSGSPDRNTSRRPVPSAPPAPRQFSAGIVAGGGRAGRRRFRPNRAVALVPGPDARQYNNGKQRRRGEPRDAALASRKYDQRGQQRAQRTPCCPPDAIRATRDDSGGTRTIPLRPAPLPAGSCRSAAQTPKAVDRKA